MPPTDCDAVGAAPAAPDLHESLSRRAPGRAWVRCLCFAAVLGCDPPPTVVVARSGTDAGITPGEGGETAWSAGDIHPAPAAAVAIDDALSVAAGGASSCVLLPRGEVWCWGGAGPGTPAVTADDERAGRIDLAGVTALTLGQWSICGILPGGRVVCDVDAGELTSGEVPDLTDVTSLSAGWDHVCAVDEAGRAWCWGNNGAGQVGLAPSAHAVPAPVEVPGLPHIVQISAGDDRSCACAADGSVWCWGSGQANGPAPAPIEGLPSAVEVAVRGTLVCLRQADGGVMCWGGRSRRPPEPVEGLSRATALVVGDEFACALRDDGRVLCWGDDEFGQLGREARTTENHVAGEVSGLAEVTALSAGQRHVCARTRSGHVFCWGKSSDGQTGRRTHHRSLPTLIDGLSDIVDLSLGVGTACARASDGRVTCWGDEGAARCRGGAVQVDGTAGTGQVAVGSGGRLCFLRPDATVACGGEAAPEDVGLIGVVELAAGEDHFCARHSDGGVSCWGGNDLGQLGDGTTEFRETPERVQGLEDISQIVAARDRTCVRQRDRALCFGRTAVAGEPEGGPTTRPTQVADLGPVSELFGSEDAVCARHTGDIVSCWGETEPGAEHPPTVVRVALPGRLHALATTGLQTCAVLEGGEFRCWRTNYVQAFTTAGHPVAAPGVGRARAVAGAGGTTCAVRDAGDVLCWGTNYHGLVTPAEPCFHSDPNEVRR